MVLDDAVVHYGDGIVRQVWMRVLVAGHAVRSPASVRNAGATTDRIRIDNSLQVGDLALPPRPLQNPIVLHGDPSRVITTVLEPP